MLQAIRDRAQGIFAWIMLVLVGVPFALWGIQNYLDVDKEAPVVTVGDTEIFERDIARAFDQALASLGNVRDFDEALLKTQAKERLIGTALIVQDAEKRGLKISDETIRSEIQGLPYFQTDGRFDSEKYRLTLSSQGLSGALFTVEMAKSLIIDQYEKGISKSGLLPTSEIDDFLSYRNQQRQVEYFNIPKPAQQAKVDDVQVEQYFNNHREQYQTPEKVSVNYVLLDRAEIASGIKPTEEELKALYEEQLTQYSTPEKRKVSHILFSVDSKTPESEAQSKKKAEDALAKLKAGADFSALAKDVSDDRASAAKGGDLGYITKESFDPNVVAAAVALKKGDISEPTHSPFGFHLIKVTELVPGSVKPFESVRPELEKAAQHAAAESKFYELSQTLAEQGFEHAEGLDATARAVGATIQTSELFSTQEGLGIAADPAFRKAAFTQDVLDGKNSEPVELAGGEKVALMRLKDHVPSTPKSLAEVKAAIFDELTKQAAQTEMRKRADEVLAKARTEGTLEGVAKAYKVTVSKSEFFKRNDDKPSHAIVSVAFKIQALDKPESIITADLPNGEQAVIRLIAIQSGDGKLTDPKEAEMARNFLSNSVGQNEMAAYLADLRTRGDVHERAVKP